MSGLLKGGDLLAAAAIALGAAIVGPAIGPRLRPIAKSMIKAALITLDEGRSAVSRLTLATGDFVAEVRQELGRGDMFTSEAPQAPAKAKPRKRRGGPAKPPARKRPRAERPSTPG